jgi:hypothetical protein
VERIVAAQLIHHLEANSLLDPNQHAYRVAHSCESALLTVADATFDAMDHSKVMILVLLDLSAAFDTVDHRLLIQKLGFLGVSGQALNWLSTYLSGRTQSVVVGNAKSLPRTIVCGVPQGSVLGPLLFTIYLIGIGDILRSYNIHYVIYADDIQLFISSTVENIASVISQLEQCLADIRRWLVTNFLMLNDSKTELIIIGNSRLLKKCPSLLLHIGSDTISPIKSSVRDLGFHIDSSLKLEPHVNKLVAMAFGQLKSISRLRKCLTSKTQLMLINTFILSRFDFSGSLLHNVSSKLMSRMQSVQNASIRVLRCLKKQDPIRPHLLQLKMLPIRERLLFRTLCLIFKVRLSSLPSSLAKQLVPKQASRNLRSQSDEWLLSEHHFSTATGGRAFRHFAPRLWNSLPLHLRRITSFTSFRDKLSDYIFGTISSD